MNKQKSYSLRQQNINNVYYLLIKYKKLNIKNIIYKTRDRNLIKNYINLLTNTHNTHRGEWQSVSCKSSHTVHYYTHTHALYILCTDTTCTVHWKPNKTQRINTKLYP